MSKWRHDKEIKFESDYAKSKTQQFGKIATCVKSVVGKEPISPQVVSALNQSPAIPQNRKQTAAPTTGERDVSWTNYQ